MSNTKTMQAGPKSGELTLLLNQLTEQKAQMERLLGRVEDVLRAVNFSGKAGRAALAADGTAQSRKSPLDQVKAVIESTADLREANGNLSAARVARVFGVSLSQLAQWLERTKQALSKTPDADSLQEPLGYFERVARLRMITHGDGEFRKWLRTPHELLDNAPPLELLARREWRTLADYVEDILTGNPG
jgi:uncharacterized protein (DUF2384 family)